tara:strand:- start:344 stop:784 length:441 start_codon:yes stop_codon:yes gene_type:complete
MTKILIKRLSDKVLIPKYETIGSSGMDIAAFLENKIEIEPSEKTIIPSGFCLSIPKGFEIQIRPRSGLAAKNGITVLNTPGTIDSDYRGEIKVILINLSKKKFTVENGLRIAQMVVCPVIKAELESVSDLSKTVREGGGFGSTGTK